MDFRSRCMAMYGRVAYVQVLVVMLQSVLVLWHQALCGGVGTLSKHVLADAGCAFMRFFIADARRVCLVDPRLWQ